jgi:hypothetical protein
MVLEAEQDTRRQPRILLYPIEKAGDNVVPLNDSPRNQRRNAHIDSGDDRRHEAIVRSFVQDACPKPASM